ncbi:uncharacterized protein LOC128669892 [Plodia interpunctella]|uniref:uncharacterized protein LOC128669892 n=1 Tax=Plodia interpunctella TaxID=58824 RepID=UPI002367B78D|nr:uncharacterized protein LOC128669892 [Plodia interpunctella]
MPQTFQVLRCYKCSIFQVHQVKKSNKYECKLCGEKQSIKRHYGLGSGKECRLHVQKLNGIRGNIDDLDNSLASDDENCEEVKNINQNDDVVNSKKESKWMEYLDKTEIDTCESNNNMYFNNTEVVLEMRSKQRKFTRNKSRSSYKFKDQEDVLQRESIEDTIIEYQPNDTSDISNKLQLGITSTSKQMVRKTFIPPSCSKISKWANYIDDAKNVDEGGASADMERKNLVISNNVLFNSELTDKETNDSQINLSMNNPSRNNNIIQSKNNHQFNSLSIRKTIAKNPTQKLFSLCNDNDLDNILDI